MSCALYLASSSPQRRRILKALGFEFSIIYPQIDESAIKCETAREYVSRLAIQKARKGSSLLGENTNDVVVIGADTCVSVDNYIMGKPRHREEALSMLQKLSGRVHEVHSAVAVRRGTEEYSLCDTTKVYFMQLTQLQLAQYLQDDEYQNRAGAYAIQGQAAKFVCRLEGSYSSVIGLPVTLTMQLLANVGLAVSDIGIAKRNLEKEFPKTILWDGQYCV